MQSDNIVIRSNDRDIKLLQGEDIQPQHTQLTRRQKFYRALYHSEQEIPKPITKEEHALKNAVDYVRSLENRIKELEERI